MVHRGGFSFVAMLVINPIVILFYQNCSMSPLSVAARDERAPASIIGSVNAKSEIPQSNSKTQAASTCQGSKDNCLKPEMK